MYIRNTKHQHVLTCSFVVFSNSDPLRSGSPLNWCCIAWARSWLGPSSKIAKFFCRMLFCGTQVPSTKTARTLAFCIRNLVISIMSILLVFWVATLFCLCTLQDSLWIAVGPEACHLRTVRRLGRLELGMLV